MYGSPEGTWCDNLIIRPDGLIIRPDELLNCHTMSLRGFRRNVTSVVPDGTWFPEAVKRVANCYT